MKGTCLRTFMTRSGKSQSSHLWLQRQAKDVYVKEREKQHYVARSAFKLIEINEKKKFLKPGATVLDLGAAPVSFFFLYIFYLRGDVI